MKLSHTCSSCPQAWGRAAFEGCVATQALQPLSALGSEGYIAIQVDKLLKCQNLFAFSLSKTVLSPVPFLERPQTQLNFFL